MGSTTSLVPILVLLLLAFAAKPSSATGFKCSKAGSTCKALVGYKPKNKTSLDSIRTLFSIPDLRTLLAANNLSDSTPASHSVLPAVTVRIPVNCSCKNNTGTSDRSPTYTVKAGDSLDAIAASFSRLITYTDIANANNIPNPNLIEPGQKFTIPLPCSCDQVGGVPVVHYGYLVRPGDSVSVIASQFDTTEAVLLERNGMTNGSQLKADQVLDVPLKVCNSSVKNDSLDYPLLVAKDAYVYTANSCVKCSCSSLNNWTLKCDPSDLPLSSKASCPPVKCDASSYLGNTTSTACTTSTCSYTGYSSSANISAELVTQSTCPPKSAAGPECMGLGWKLTFVSIVAAFLFIFL